VNTIELIAVDGGEIQCGCTHCRAVWRAEPDHTVQCPVCGAESPWASLWVAWAGPSGVPLLDPPPLETWSEQAHRTAMLAVLIVVVSIWALTLCVRLAHGQTNTIKLCVPDYDSVTKVTVLNSRRSAMPPEPTPTGLVLSQDIPVPPTRTPVPAGVCPDLDPATTGYVEVPITSLTRRGIRNTWAAWSVSSDDVTSDASNTITPPPLRQRPARLLP